MACAIMVLVVFFAHKLTKPAITTFGDIQTNEIQKQREIHTLVTGIHVTLILVYTLLSFLIDNVKLFDGADGQTVSGNRIYSAWLLFGGL